VTKSRDASRYRDDAARFRKRAAAASDDHDLRDSYLSAAREFDRLADLLEEKSTPQSAAASTTRLRLSRRRARQQRRGAIEHRPKPGTTVSGDQHVGTSMLTVVVIDADPAVRLAVKNVLEPAGFTIITVADAADALERLPVINADLVICDIDAAAPDGTPAIRAIPKIDPTAQILALMPKQRDIAVPLPSISKVLEKPFTASELLREIRRALVGSPHFCPKPY
jgi:two-component system, chemotaxis family, chemotaxis protein CheY